MSLLRASSLKVGDIVYGYAEFYDLWAYCKVNDIREDRIFGDGVSHPNYFYMMYFDKIVPAEIVQSPLWKALE